MSLIIQTRCSFKISQWFQHQTKSEKMIRLSSDSLSQWHLTL